MVRQEQPPPEEADPSESPIVQAPTALQSMGAMWLYSLMRFALFFILWALLWVARVPGLLAAVIAVVLSIPLSMVLLRKPRARLAANLEQRVQARKARVENLDDKLSGGQHE